MSRAFGVVLFLSGALKIALALAFADLIPRYDEVEFLDFGRRILAGAAPELWRAPGYQSFVAAGLGLAGGKAVGVRLLQAVLSTLTVAMLYRTVRRRFPERVAFVAATFLAFYPSHVAFSHLIWAETLFLLLVVGAFDRLLAMTEGTWSAAAAWRAAVAAGAFLGLACLVRSLGVALLVVSAGWLLFSGVRRARVAVLVGVAILVLAPWSIHASRRAERFVLVDTNPGWNLWSGNNEFIPDELQGIWGTALGFANGLEESWGPRLAARGIPPALAGLRLHAEWPTEMARQRAADGIRDMSSPQADLWYRDHALAEMRRDPLGVVARVPLKLAAFWSPDFFLPRHVLRDWYGAAPPFAAGALLLLTWAAAAVPLLLGPAALAGLPASPFRSLSVTWLVTALALHAMLFGVSRMHQWLVPFLVVAAALAALGDAPVRWRRGAPFAAVAILLWIVSLPAVAGVYINPGPRHAGASHFLGAVRHLPLPGARYATWMVAEGEAGRGHDDAARRILEGSRFSDLPQSLLLRAMVAEDDAGTQRLAAELVRSVPESQIARWLLATGASP